MKTTLKEELKKMNKLAKRMPKTINETLNFESDEMMDDEMEMEEEPKAQIQPQEQGLDVASFVDDIRKKSLKGMASLADQPESPEYQLLKKIWQICDKKPEQDGQQIQQAKPM